jgi:hypothetical protein
MRLVGHIDAGKMINSLNNLAGKPSLKGSSEKNIKFT